MGKWIFRMIVMAVIGGGVIITAQIGDGGEMEKEMPVQTEAEIRAAKAEKGDGIEEKEASSSEGGMIQGGKEKETPSSEGGRMQSGEEKETPSGEGGTIQSGREPVRKELMDMYFRAFCELIHSDSGLGENAACLGFDFSKAGSPTQSEGEVLAERLKEKFHKEKVIFGTWEELKKAGYINGADLCWEDGMLLTLEVTKEKKKRIVFSVSAWRSGLGAVGRDDCEAERSSDGKWKMDEEKPVKSWIS